MNVIRLLKKPNSAPSLFDRRENICDNFAARLRAQVSFTVNANAYSIGFQVPFSDDEHGVHFHLFGALDFAVDLVSAFVEFRTDLMGAELIKNRHRIFEDLCIVTDRQDAHLFGSEPEREIAGVMLNQESDETLVCAERRAMDAERNFVDVITIFVAKIETPRLGKINLVRRDGKLAADRAPGLDIDLRPVKRGFI